jgi:hypothetical protein
MGRKKDLNINGKPLPPPRVRKSRASAGGKARWAHKVRPEDLTRRRMVEAGQRQGARIRAGLAEMKPVFWNAWYGDAGHLEDLRARWPHLAAAIGAFDRAVLDIKANPELKADGMRQELVFEYVKDKCLLQFVGKLPEYSGRVDPDEFMRSALGDALKGSADRNGPLWDWYLDLDLTGAELRMRDAMYKQWAKDERYRSGRH